jgi:hypothetical protein
LRGAQHGTPSKRLKSPKNTSGTVLAQCLATAQRSAVPQDGTQENGKMGFSMVRGSAIAATFAMLATASVNAHALDDASGTTCVTDPLSMTSVCTTGEGGTGPSTFLGAFASDNHGKGGWVEFYSDSEGEWWVEHHADGGTSIGWEVGNGANYMNGPSAPFGSKEGSYKKKPALKGAVTKGEKLSLASLKLASQVKTASVGAMSAPAATILRSNATVDVNISGVGTCSGRISVQKNGQFVSSTGIVPMTFPLKRAVPLPNEVGQYLITFDGKNGCMGVQKRSVVSVVPMRLGGL